MGQTRKNHSKEFKAKVALEAVKGVHSLSELAARYKVHLRVRRIDLTGAPQVFERSGGSAGPDAEVLTAPLFQEIGRLKMELDFLQKKH